MLPTSYVAKRFNVGLLDGLWIVICFWTYSMAASCWWVPQSPKRAKCNSVMKASRLSSHCFYYCKLWFFQILPGGYWLTVDRTKQTKWSQGWRVTASHRMIPSCPESEKKSKPVSNKKVKEVSDSPALFCLWDGYVCFYVRSIQIRRTSSGWQAREFQKSLFMYWHQCNASELLALVIGTFQTPPSAIYRVCMSVILDWT